LLVVDSEYPDAFHDCPLLITIVIFIVVFFAITIARGKTTKIAVVIIATTFVTATLATTAVVTIPVFVLVVFAVTIALSLTTILTPITATISLATFVAFGTILAESVVIKLLTARCTLIRTTTVALVRELVYFRATNGTTICCWIVLLVLLIKGIPPGATFS
jgi:hypothetical protein